MPSKPLKPCRHPYCPELTSGRFCKEHARQYEKERETSYECGYTSSRWRAARRRFLEQHPLCVYCLKNDKVVAAEVVDHIVPHRGDQKLFWDESNWQPLCKRCHDRKTFAKDVRPVYRY